jgi:hypothetical protein
VYWLLVTSTVVVESKTFHTASNIQAAACPIP